METLYKQLLEAIGEDINRPGLQGTPKRAAKAFEYLTHGYNLDIAKVINRAVFPSDDDEMIIVKIIGISKLARIVDAFARRLQIQENLTKQIAETIMKYTGALGVGIIIEAQHLCMMMRGVEKQNSI